MSLTQDDLQHIRAIVREGVESVIRPLEGEVKALREDVKELYKMVSELERGPFTVDAPFKKLPLEEQLLKVNSWLVDVAKKEGIVLPR